MAHHAYLYAGDRTQGIRSARAYARTALGLEGSDNPDVAVFEYGLFSVDDARRVGAFASQAPVRGAAKLVAIAAGRLFHEAQNALLKLFEEPVEGTTLVLIVPAEGILLPTLRSRLIRLPAQDIAASQEEGPADAFLSAGSAERTKIVATLLARSKSDTDAEKQQARLDAVAILDGVTEAAYVARKEADAPQELDLLLGELARFAPLMHERSAPLKPILEHLLIVLPEKLRK